MLRLLATVGVLVAIAASAPSPNPSNIFEIDISPEEAQQYLNSPPFTAPKLATKTATLPLVRYDSPSFRSAEAGPTLGHYWKNGREIENTDDYVEEVHDASQFHGQDGLGAYAYGYQTPESSKVENRVRSGDVTGSYIYRTADGQLIEVRYWADSEGFHQEDNLPKVELKPVEDTEEVRQARVAHLKAWQEAADAAAQNPDTDSQYQPDQYENHNYQGSASNVQNAVVAAPGAANAQTSPALSAQASDVQARQGKAYFNQNQQSYSQSGSQNFQSKQQYQKPQFQAQASAQAYQGQAQAQSGYQSQAQGSYQKPQNQEEEVEPTGPPRGFFYSFNYPVSTIIAKNGGQQNQNTYPGEPVDHDTSAVNSSYRG